MKTFNEYISEALISKHSSIDKPVKDIPSEYIHDKEIKIGSHYLVKKDGEETLLGKVVFYLLDHGPSKKADIWKGCGFKQNYYGTSLNAWTGGNYGRGKNPVLKRNGRLLELVPFEEWD